MSDEQIAAQRRKRIIRVLRVLIAAGVAGAVMFVWLLLVGVALVAGAI